MFNVTPCPLGGVSHHVHTNELKTSVSCLHFSQQIFSTVSRFGTVLRITRYYRCLYSAERWISYPLRSDTHFSSSHFSLFCFLNLESSISRFEIVATSATRSIFTWARCKMVDGSVFEIRNVGNVGATNAEFICPSVQAVNLMWMSWWSLLTSHTVSSRGVFILPSVYRNHNCTVFYWNLSMSINIREWKWIVIASSLMLLGSI